MRRLKVRLRQWVALVVRAAVRRIRRSLGWLNAHVSQVAAVAAVIVPVLIWAGEAEDGREQIAILEAIERNTREAATLARSPASDGLPIDVQDIVDTSGDQLTNVAELVVLAAQGGGQEGPIGFKKHVDDPASNELRKAVDHGVTGIGLLLAFPTMAAHVNKHPPRRAYDAAF